jgi:hypothetical protein
MFVLHADMVAMDKAGSLLLPGTRDDTDSESSREIYSLCNKCRVRLQQCKREQAWQVPAWERETTPKAVGTVTIRWIQRKADRTNDWVVKAKIDGTHHWKRILQASCKEGADYKQVSSVHLPAASLPARSPAQVSR